MENTDPINKSGGEIGTREYEISKQESDKGKDNQVEQLGSDLVNVSESIVAPQEEPSGKKGSLKKILLIVGVVLFVILLSWLGVWGYTRYERVYVSVDTEKILPKETDFVARVTIQEASQQIQFLKDMGEKFPGYEAFRKNLDDVGEGKDVDETFLDAWKKAGIDFDEDLLPAIGNEVWVVVPDLQPVEQMIGQEIGSIFGSSRPSEFAFGVGGEMNIREKVLGKSTKIQPIENSQKHTTPLALDFILATPIVDLEKAIQVAEKIEKGGDRFQVTKKTYKGYSYLEVFDTQYEAKEKGRIDEGLRLNVGRTYYAILGGNWIGTSHNGWMEEMIDRRESLAIFSFSEKKTFLEENEMYRRVMTSLRAEGENLLSVYYKWNTESSPSEIQEQGMREGGFSAHFNEEGLLMRSYASSNEKEFKQIPNKYREGLAKIIPKKMNGQWADIYLEIPDGKTAYYDFKRNYLTEEGLAEWTDELDEAQRETGLHFERDFIDYLIGSVGIIAYTGKGTFPGTAMIWEMRGGESLVRRIFDIAAGAWNYSFAMEYQACKTQKNLAYCKDVTMRKASVEEVTIDGGKMYRVRIEGSSFKESVPPYEMCGAVSMGEESRVVFSTSCSIAKGLIGMDGGASQETLSTNAEYVSMEKYVGEQGFSRIHIVPLGLLYFVYGVYNGIAGSSGDGLDSMGGQSASTTEGEWLQGWEGIVKTIPSITIQNESKEESVMFIHIKELPQEEKYRYDTAVGKMFSSLSEARESAMNAQFKVGIAEIVLMGIVCCDENDAPLGSKEGEKICSKMDGKLPTAKGLGIDAITYSVKKDCNESGEFEYEISASGAGVCSGVTKVTQDGAVFPSGCEKETFNKGATF